MIKINTSGDYVQLIYVDPVQESVQQELRSDTDAFECSYDSEGKLYMQFGAMRFENPDPTDFTINGVAVTDAADFISKLNALFTGGGGGGVTIYTGDGSLSGERVVTLGGNLLHFREGSGQTINVTIDPTPLGENFTVYVQSLIGDGNVSTIQALSQETQAAWYVRANFNDGVKIAKIEAYANASESENEYTADTHTFNGVINLPTHAAPASPNDGDIWREDNTDTGLKIRINGLTKTITVS